MGARRPGDGETGLRMQVSEGTQESLSLKGKELWLKEENTDPSGVTFKVKADLGLTPG